jgi:hypothetical protein
MEKDFQNLVSSGTVTELKTLVGLTSKTFGYDVDTYYGRNKYFALKSLYEWKKRT